jgi:hypothetical protein
VQAIQSIESATMEVPRRSSPFRALIWKEWRQQRWIFLSLAGLAYVLLLSALIVTRFGQFRDEEKAGVLCSIAVWIGLMGVAVLSANAFAGERDDNSDLFLETMPCSRSKLFWVKLGFVLFLVLAELIPVAAAAHVDFNELLREGGPTFVLLTAAVLLFATVPALIASFGGSVIATILASLAVIGACYAYLRAPALLAPFLPNRSGELSWPARMSLRDMPLALFVVLMLATILLAAWRMWTRVERTWRISLRTAVATAALLIGFRLLPVEVAYLDEFVFAPHPFFATPYAVLTFAAILLATWRMWSRPERTWRSSLRAAAATAGLLIASVAVPIAAAYLYVTLFAPFSFFMSGSHAVMMSSFGFEPFASATVSAISPDGKYVAFDAHYHGWGASACRVALVDTDSGRTQWPTRFQGSRVSGWIRGYWSPSGNQFILTEGDQWLSPWSRYMEDRIYFVVDARSGEERSFEELWPGLRQMTSSALWPIGWYSDQVLAFQNGRDIFFADIESHQVRQCKMPVASPAPFFGVLPSNTRRGIFAPVKGIPAEGEVRVLRYSPELAEAESITLYGVIRGIQSVMMSASEDGQWLLLSAYVNDHGKWSSYQYLAQSADGAKAALFVSAEAGEKGLIAPSWKLNGFVPGGHQVLLYREAELGLFDAASHDLRRIPMAQASGMEIASVELSPAGGFVLVHCENPRTAPEPGLTRKDFIVDLHNGTSSTIDVANQPWKQRLRWMGEDHWLLEIYGWMPRVINRDGTGDRPLLAD